MRGATWPARQRVMAGWAGAHHSRLRGHAPEFTEYRPFRQGDDPRRLDWKLLARMDRAYLRLSDDRSSLATLLLVDASASMAFPAQSLAKWRQACGLAVGLASVVQGQGDAVGLVVPRDARGGAADVPPRVHRRVLAELAAVLEGVTPGGVPSLVRSLAAERWPRRVVVVSDFLSEADGLLARARHLVVQGVEVVGIHVVSQQELEPSDRSVTAVDPEAPVVRRPYAPAARASYQGAFGAWREAVAGDWRTAGAAFHQVLAEEATAAAVRRVIRPAP